jgi:hypothetical protein
MTSPRLNHSYHFGSWRKDRKLFLSIICNLASPCPLVHMRAPFVLTLFSFYNYYWTVRASSSFPHPWLLSDNSLAFPGPIPYPYRCNLHLSYLRSLLPRRLDQYFAETWGATCLTAQYRNAETEVSVFVMNAPKLIFRLTCAPWQFRETNLPFVTSIWLSCSSSLSKLAFRTWNETFRTL